MVWWQGYVRFYWINIIQIKILRLDEDMKTKKFRIQKDSLKTINICLSLFIKLLTKTCEVVQTTSSSSIVGKRAGNTLDIDHLVKAVKRYEVLAFMQDLLHELNEKSREPQSLLGVDRLLEQVDESLGKRKERVETPDKSYEPLDVAKKARNGQASITSFFKSN
jgi:hypothetical protein